MRFGHPSESRRGSDLPADGGQPVLKPPAPIVEGLEIPAMYNSSTLDGNQATASRPVTGRWLAHAKLSAVERAFIGSDLVDGRLQLVRPTLTAAAHLARTNTTYVQWALQRQAERLAIEAGTMPLVPAQRLALPSSTSAQDRLADLVAELGSSQVLDLLAGIDAAIGGGNDAATNGAIPH